MTDWLLGLAERMARLGEIVIACIIMAITLPLMVFVGLAIKLESPGPVLDGETRIGSGGRRFQMLNHGTGATTANRAVGSNTDPCRSVSAADAY
jgi:lipopolysaccharide/colanic/teichoic acid biosynthesis glycosyltransferase